MRVLSLTIAFLALALELNLLWRAKRGSFLFRYPLFFSYLAYVFIWSVVTLPFYIVGSNLYSSVFWFCFLVMKLAEFAVLLEVSDHLFEPYPAIRWLGRIVALLIGSILLLAYLIPTLFENAGSMQEFLDLDKKSSIIKAIVIVALLLVARSYRLHFDRSVSGLMLGFAVYLALMVANTVLLQALGIPAYAKTYSVVAPSSFVLALSIWTAALWQYVPAAPPSDQFTPGDAGLTLSGRLGKYDSELTRLFRR